MAVPTRRALTKIIILVYAGLCPGMNVRLWSRDLTTEQRVGHFSSTWCFGHCAGIFPRLLFVCFVFWVGGSLYDEFNTSNTTSHKSRASMTSFRKRASTEVSSDSVEQ